MRKYDALKAKYEPSVAVLSSVDQMSEADHRLKQANERMKEVLSRGAAALDGIKSELDGSIYTLEDDEFETVYYVRDILQQALAECEKIESGE